MLDHNQESSVCTAAAPAEEPPVGSAVESYSNMAFISEPPGPTGAGASSWDAPYWADAPAPPKPQPRSGMAPRAMWLTLHVVGLYLLNAAEAWPEEPLFMVVLAAVLLLYAFTSFSDPGFVAVRDDAGPLDAALLDLPECLHCGALQPGRAKHCHTCGRCVHRLDHHCLWLGNCVGELNHRAFISYLVAQGILLLWVFVAASSSLINGGHDPSADPGSEKRVPLSFLKGLAAVVCCLLCGVLAIAVFTLVAFQIMLVVRGETTWENLRRAKINESQQLPPLVRPYDRGVRNNILIFCRCAHDPNSSLQRRKLVVRMPSPEETMVSVPITIES